MTYQELRAKYPKFVYESFSHHLKGNQLLCEFKYSIPPDHRFTHTVTFENLSTPPGWANALPGGELVFQLGLAEMFSYWKLTSSPIVEITAGHLTPDQIKFWHKLFIKGMGQYFYENHIDFTDKNFLVIKNGGTLGKSRAIMPPERSEGARTPSKMVAAAHDLSASQVLTPLGGGKDSIVTAELLKNHFHIRPIIVYPTTPASERVSRLITPTPPIVVRRILDPYMLKLTKQDFLTGHIPYSAALAFIFLLAAASESIPYIAVSNEAGSDEGNVNYLGHTINHQYSKSFEFETDFQNYISQSLSPSVSYFSFLRPLHELQIAQLFSKMPQYFKDFRSCNKNQQADSWCGHCPKCLSVALTLMPWVGEAKVIEIIGANPLTDPANHKLLAQMTDPAQVKPFECIVSTEEAQVCLEFIQKGQTDRIKKFLSHRGPSAMPPQFESILNQEYYRT